jgi:outer membrane protein assembly factor BamB
MPSISWVRGKAKLAYSSLGAWLENEGLAREAMTAAKGMLEQMAVHDLVEPGRRRRPRRRDRLAPTPTGRYPMSMPGAWAAAALALLCAVRANAEHPANCWPRFRGVDGSGVGAGKPLPETWSATENVLWKAKVPGKGWSSPIVWGDRVFLTSAIPPGAVDPPTTPKEMPENAVGIVTTQEQRWIVLCLRLKTGKILWQREAHRAVPDWRIHPKGSHASETPVTDGERVYALIGNVGLFCYTMEGKPLWSSKWGPRQMMFNWGTAIGPAVADGRVFAVNDNEEKSYLACLEAKTGKELWRHDRDEKSNWCNPVIWRNQLRTELVTAGSRRVRSYSLDGELLWELQGMSYATIPSPFLCDGLLYVASGHASGPVRPIYAIKPGAAGDISLKTGATTNAFIAWSNPTAGPYVPTPMAMDGYLYDLTDVSGMFCYKAATGEPVYKRQRFGPGGGQFTASPVGGDGKIYCLGEKGDVFVVKAGPEFKVLGKNSLNEDTLATPAIVDGTLLIRTLTHLYRIGK